MGRITGPACHHRRRLERSLRRRRQDTTRAIEHRITRFRCLAILVRQMSCHMRIERDAVFLDDRQGIVARGGIGYRRTRGDHRRVVAGHIRDHQRDQPSRGTTAASRPPLIAEKCFLTQFISPISAPERSSALLTACLSARVRPRAGNAERAEPPPDIRAMTRSSCPSPRPSP